jgi:hypothetical protein
MIVSSWKFCAEMAEKVVICADLAGAFIVPCAFGKLGLSFFFMECTVATF